MRVAHILNPFRVESCGVEVQHHHRCSYLSVAGVGQTLAVGTVAGDASVHIVKLRAHPRIVDIINETVARAELGVRAHVGVHGLGLDLCGAQFIKARHSHFREHIPRESRGIRLRARAFAGIFLNAQRRLALVVHLHGLTLASAYLFQPYPTGDFLGKAYHKPSVCSFYAHGLQHRSYAVGGRGVCCEPSRRRRSALGPLPSALVAVGLCPMGRLESCIVSLAFIHAVHRDGRWSCEPRCVSGHHLACAVVIRYLYLTERTGLAERPHAPALSVVESAAQHQPYGVIALLHLVGNVVCQIHYPVVCEARVDGDIACVEAFARGVVGEVGHEVVLAHALAVDVQLKESSCRDESLRPFDAALQGECLAQQRCAVGLCGRYPLRLPVGGLEESHAPMPCLAPFRPLAAHIPCLHAPVAVLARGESPSAVRHQHRLVRWHAPAVPEVVASASQTLLCGGHYDAVGRLPLALHALVLWLVDP